MISSISRNTLKLLSSCLIAACCLLNSHAQEATSVTEMKKLAFANPFDASNENLIQMLNREDAMAQASVMLYDTWVPMDAFGLDSTKLHIDSANYHIQLNKILFYNSAQLYELFPERVALVTIGSRTFVALPIKTPDNKIKRQFFELLEQGEYTLLSRLFIKKKVINNHPMGMPGTTEEKLVQEEEFYYLRHGARLPEPMPTRKKDFIMIFRSNRPQMAGFASENKINLHSKDDLKSAFAYYNSLVAN